MPRLTSLSLTLLSTLLLAACGGGGDGGGSSTATRTLSGVAADGYLQGAFVCIDRNDNLRCDSDEPRTTTNSLGAYTLEGLTGEDVTEHRVLVEVHTGVIDSDNPGVRVDMPYILTAPVGKHAFISPFSTLVAGIMLQHPELSTDQAVELNSRLLNTPSGLMLGNYMVGESSDAGKQRLHRIGRGLSREIAYFVKHAKLLPAYATNLDNSILSALAMHMTNPFKLKEILDADFFDTTVNRRFLDANNLNNAIEEVELLTGLARKTAKTLSLQEYLTNSGPRFSINDEFPSDCHHYSYGWTYPETCPADYPAGSAYLLEYESEQIGTFLYTGLSESLVSLETGLPVRAPTPRFNSLYLHDGEWIGGSPHPGPVEVSKIESRNVRSFDISGINIRKFLRHPNLINGQDFAEPLQMGIPADATFPQGATASRDMFTTKQNHYQLSDTNPFNDDVDLLSPIKSPENGGGAITTLEEFIEYFNPSMGNHALTLKIQTETIDGVEKASSYYSFQFSSPGRVLVTRTYLNPDGNINHETTMPNGSWRKYTEGGKEFLEARFPAGFAIQDTPLVWTEYSGGVRNVFFIAAGTTFESLYFNETAINAIRTALQN